MFLPQDIDVYKKFNLLRTWLSFERQMKYVPKGGISNFCLCQSFVYLCSVVLHLNRLIGIEESIQHNVMQF